MNSLKKERDRFVGRTPTPIDRAAATKPSKQQLIRADVAPIDVSLIDAPLIDLPLTASSDEVAARSERADIVRRVAAFRDHQIRIRQEREAYYDAMLAKTRAALRSDTGRL